MVFLYTLISKILSDNKKCPPENWEGKKLCFIKALYFLLILIGLNRKELTIIEWILFFQCIVVQKN